MSATFGGRFLRRGWNEVNITNVGGCFFPYLFYFIDIKKKRKNPKREAAHMLKKGMVYLLVMEWRWRVGPMEYTKYIPYEDIYARKCVL